MKHNDWSYGDARGDAFWSGEGNSMYEGEVTRYTTATPVASPPVKLEWLPCPHCGSSECSGFPVRNGEKCYRYYLIRDGVLKT